MPTATTRLKLGLMGIALLGSSVAMAKDVTPTQFVEKAGASDKFEIASARLLATSDNAAIKAFAIQMITDHSKSTMMVKAAARADHVVIKTPNMTVKQRADLTALKVAPGKTKEDLYIKQQKAAHADALELMQGYAADGTKRHLKATAGKIAPVVEQHIAMLDKM